MQISYRREKERKERATPSSQFTWCVGKEKQVKPCPHGNNKKWGLKSVCGERGKGKMREQVGDDVQKGADVRAEAEGGTLYKSTGQNTYCV